MARIKKDNTRALFIQRFLAFIIDVMIVSLIVSFVSYPFHDYDKIIVVTGCAGGKVYAE